MSNDPRPFTVYSRERGINVVFNNERTARLYAEYLGATVALYHGVKHVATYLPAGWREARHGFVKDNRSGTAGL
jgi:hypothetical protein